MGEGVGLVEAPGPLQLMATRACNEHCPATRIHRWRRFRLPLRAAAIVFSRSHVAATHLFFPVPGLSWGLQPGRRDTPLAFGESLLAWLFCTFVFQFSSW